MFKNYFITTIRTYFISKKIGNRSFFTYINLIGLIIGLAAFLIIAHLVRYELSYDRFFPNAKNIYRVTVEKTQEGQSTLASAKTYPGVGNILKNEIKEVESFARVLKEECMLHYKPAGIKFNRQFTYWADKSFLSMFSLDFIEKGDTSNFDKPYNCVLSQSTAERYFGKNWEGDKTPIGKTIHLNHSLPFIIQGVYKDLPPNAHMEVDFVVSYSTLVALAGPDCETGMPPFRNINYTYVSLKPAASYKQIEALAQKSLSTKIPATASSQAQFQFSLQPITSIHLNSHLTDELKPNGNRSFVIALSVAAILILVVAWINFINLATARALNRAKEVGVRKAIGSSKKQLVSQFIFEALFASVIAAIGAVILVFFFSGRIEKMAGIPDSVFSLEKNGIYSWLLFLGIMLCGGLLSSIYPAIILSSFKPVEVLKGKMATGNKGFFRKGLISFQFFFAVFLLCCTGAIYYQVKYMREQSLGLSTEQVLVLHSPRSMIGSKKRIDKFKTFRQSLLQYPAIAKVGSSACLPGDEFLSHWEGVQQTEKDNGKDLSYDVAYVDEGYLPTLDFKLVAGRNFIDWPGEDKKIIPNEATIKALGFKDNNEAIGKIIRTRNNKEYEIAGVTGDAHYEGLQKNIRPMLLLFGHNYEFGFFSMKIDSKNVNQTIAAVQRKWEENYPNDPFDYFFLDSFFDRQYQADQKFGKIFGLFSFLAIFIACLGLIGLVAYTTFQKTKEIGIRKVLGASLAGIVALITKEFANPILIACLAAIPISHLVIAQWLNGFAYRAQFDWWMYLLPLVLIVALAFIAISFQSLKAATANPVKALREE